MASVLAHITGLGLSGLLLARGLSGDAPIPPPIPAPAAQLPDDAIEIELPKVSGGSLLGDAKEAPTPEPEALARGGGEGLPRPDSGHAGRGGSDTADQAAMNLADRDDKILMSPDLMSRFDRSQVQRIKSGTERRSREDWRASREPMELTFVASGASDSTRPERRKESDRDPSAGAPLAGRAMKRGGDLGAEPLPAGFGGEAPRDPGSADVGGDRASVGAGVRDGAVGSDHRDSAKLAFARPSVQEGTPSVPANREGKPSDNKDSEQEVATRVASIFHASAAGGAPGSGPGGQSGQGATGSGGVNGGGSNAKALGTGVGPGLDNDPRDKRRTEYMRQVMSKIGARCLEQFPKWAAAEGLQGTVIVAFTIRADGSISAPAVKRPSGIPEFDENCKQSVARAAPFPALPVELGPTFSWSLPFTAQNPAVLPPRVKHAD
jgi:TonB family protein